MSVLYGHRAPRTTTGEGTEFPKLQLDFMYVVDLGKAPPVDIFPILKYVPARFAKWKRDALDVKRRQENLFGRLMDMVKRRVDAGKSNGSFMEEAYQKRSEWGIDSDSMLRQGFFRTWSANICTYLLFRNLGGALLEASDTSSAFLQAIILMLVAYPEAQSKAQQEIDEIVGPDRLPTWDDIPKLKYMNAFIEEVRCRFPYSVLLSSALIAHPRQGYPLQTNCTLSATPCNGEGRNCENLTVYV